MTTELPIVFDCCGRRLLGIFHPAARDSDVILVIVVGGPQYRVGSHRQFVIMARRFAESGIPAFRFDYRGMGDAEGAARSFRSIDDDIRSALDEVAHTAGPGKDVILLGLCDAASAILMNGFRHDCVRGMVLLNPWVTTTGSEARTYLKHYYIQRLFQKSFWQKVVRGEFSLARSIKDMFGSASAVRAQQRKATTTGVSEEDRFVEKMRSGLREFSGPVLLLISGKDLTAAEFLDLCRSDRGWRDALKSADIDRQDFPNADHTMSKRADLDAAIDRTINWIDEKIRVAT